MARRNTNSALDFIKSFNAAYDTVNRVGQDYEIGKVAKAQAETSEGFTPEQAAQIQAAAESGQNHIGYDEGAKAYVATPKLEGDQMGPAVPKVFAQQGVTDFMGKRTKALNEDQVDSARMSAMAGVMSKYDPVAGMKMRREAKRDERDDMRFGWEKDRNEREIKQANEKDAEKEFGKQLDGQVGEWFKGRLKNPDGTERAPTIDDHLASSQFRAAKLFEAGKIDQAGQVLKDYNAQAFAKIQLQGAQRTEALGKTASALAAGDLEAVKEFYNEFVPDGARVTNVQKGQDGQIVIQRESADGRPLPAHTLKDTGQMLAALNSFKDPMALYNWSQNEFRNNMALKADARADLAEGRAGASFAQGQADRAEAKNEKTAKAAAAMALFKERNPNATEAQLEAVRRGVIDATPKDSAYKVEMGDVTTALGSPAVDREGKPKVDPITGRQMVNRDPKRETEFFQWMRANNITDTNKGLAMFLGQQPQQAQQGGAGKPRYPDGTELKGKDGKTYVVRNGVPTPK